MPSKLLCTAAEQFADLGFMMGLRTLELAQAAQVPAVRKKKNIIHFSELSISENQLGNPLASFVNRASPGTTPSIGVNRLF